MNYPNEYVTMTVNQALGLMEYFGTDFSGLEKISQQLQNVAQVKTKPVVPVFAPQDLSKSVETKNPTCSRITPPPEEHDESVSLLDTLIPSTDVSFDDLVKKRLDLIKLLPLTEDPNHYLVYREATTTNPYILIVVSGGVINVLSFLKTGEIHRSCNEIEGFGTNYPVAFESLFSNIHKASSACFMDPRQALTSDLIPLIDMLENRGIKVYNEVECGDIVTLIQNTASSEQIKNGNPLV